MVYDGEHFRGLALPVTTSLLLTGNILVHRLNLWMEVGLSSTEPGIRNALTL